MQEQLSGNWGRRQGGTGGDGAGKPPPCAGRLFRVRDDEEDEEEEDEDGWPCSSRRVSQEGGHTAE